MKKDYKVPIDLTGQRFGRLLVKECIGKDKHRNTIWRCMCDCCEETKVLRGSLLRGLTKSCGCYRGEKTVQRGTKHGLWSTPEYKAWDAMKQRCYNTNHRSYHNYGGRGIYVCRRWRKSFENFIKDIGKRPSKNHSLDRINNSLCYLPFNCKWSTRTEQNRNNRHNRIIPFNGESFCMSKWAEKYKIPYAILSSRLNRLKWDIQKALTTPVKGRG